MPALYFFMTQVIIQRNIIKDALDILFTMFRSNTIDKFIPKKNSQANEIGDCINIEVERVDD